MIDCVWRNIQRLVGFGKPARQHRSCLGFLKKFSNDWSTDTSALIAYNFIIALVPLAVAAFGIFGIILRHHPNVRQDVIDSVINSLTDNNTKIAVRQVSEIAADKLQSDAGAILALGIVFAIYGASRLFVTIEKVLNIIHRAPTRPLIKQNLVAMGMLILFIFLMLLIFGASFTPTYLIDALSNQEAAQFGIFVAGIAISYSKGLVLFFLIYWIVPHKKMRFRHIWLGALIAMLLLDVFLILFPLYTRRFMGSFVGLIGFTILLILFFYYFSVILILSAQINAYFFENLPPLPADVGTFLSQVAPRQRFRSPSPLPTVSIYPQPVPAYRYLN